MPVLITGSSGFIGKNLLLKLKELSIEVIPFTRKDNIKSLPDLVNQVDFIFHMAGVNRPERETEFEIYNHKLTEVLCDAIRKSGRAIPLLFSSSIQAEQDNAYGLSKRNAEDALIELHQQTQSPIYLYRLRNIFGKWARPNYNSVVATFCYNVAHSLPIRIDDPQRVLTLTYIDDLLDDFLQKERDCPPGLIWPEVNPVYEIGLGALAEKIIEFKKSRETLLMDSVGDGLTRALYSCYLSYLSPEQFNYLLITHEDQRGRFVEILKTRDSGQFSFFSAHPGVTRGGHYHHTKNEKFLVLKGSADFGFRHMITGEVHHLLVNGDLPQVVETIPGWTHDITNIGAEELIVMLWANEIFDPKKPDTIAEKV